MHQKKDKNEKMTLSNQDAILKLLPLLEDSNSDNVDYVKSMIYENLSECKDSRLISGIIDYCMTVESQKPLLTLLQLKEPHEKHLFDKLSDLMKNEKTRYKALHLLSFVVFKGPSWLYKIASQKIMNTLLSLLKHDVCAPNLVTGIYILNCLIPSIPFQFRSFLEDTFIVFSRLAAWNIKKPSTVVDVYILHLHVAIYSLFHRLYGMFPCNFLAYLRSYYGTREPNEDNHRVFSSVIRPMLDRVRLHPLLVTASKDTELSSNRWKRLAYHDIIVECSSVSLDPLEGSYDVRCSKPMTERTQNSSFSCEQLTNTSSQSSISISFECESAVTKSIALNQEKMWSPSNAFEISTPPSVPLLPLATKDEYEYKRYSMQLSTEETAPVDLAVEAKPDVLKNDSNSNSVATDSSNSKDSRTYVVSVDSNIVEASSSRSTHSATESKEDETDREVCELTSSTKETAPPQLIRHDTPFCNTTQNLTDDFSKDAEDGEMFNTLQDNDVVSFDPPPYARLRYLSQCGTHPNIPFVAKPKVCRSISCPADLGPPATTSVSSAMATCSTCASETVAVTVTSTASSCTFMPVVAEALPSMVLPSTSSVPTAVAQTSRLASLSPPELLDRYIELGHFATCSPQLTSVSIPSSKDTDWTHFGGRPPADEISIVRNQVLLLHNQLLFERHRKDVHSERNRRILGRAKKHRIQEEQIIALKEQVKLLEQEKADLRDQLEKRMMLHLQCQAQKNELEHDLQNKLAKAKQDNDNLSFSVRNLQSLTVNQNQENNELTQEKEKCEAELRNLHQEAEQAERDQNRVRVLEKDCRFMSKQMILLQELLDHYRDREENDRNRQEDLGEQLVNSVAVQELKSFKQKFDEKSLFLTIAERKITDLEKALAEMRCKQKEHFLDLENIKILHSEEIKVLRERLRDLRKIGEQKDFCILNLHKNIETLKNEKELLKQQLTNEKSAAESDESSGKLPRDPEQCDRPSSSSEVTSNNHLKSSNTNS